MSNKEVDIPSHREMLASYRCEEISDEVYMEASAKLGEWKSTVSFGKLLQSFGENSERLLETTLGKKEALCYIIVKKNIFFCSSQLLYFSF